MPRRPLIAGNWKMNTNRAGAVALAQNIATSATDMVSIDLAVCPPFVYLDAVSQSLRVASRKVTVGAQDVYFETDGAFTGEISLSMLLDLGVTLVLTGHSERRHILHEPDELIARKTHAALRAGLTCILCIGETLDQRQRNQTDAVNERQLRSALATLSSELLPNLVIAYEPVWAIGTGKTATPADAQSAHARIRAVISSLFSPAASEGTRILYGGSVKPENARDLFSQPDVDGGLIGGASLSADSFLAIARAAC